MSNLLEYYIKTVKNGEYEPEQVLEMASVRPKENLKGILLTINPDINRTRDPYFKVYDSDSWTTARNVWRVYFNKPEFVKAHTRKKEVQTVMNSKMKKQLILALNSKSKNEPEYTVWQSLKFHWNDELNFCSGSIADYYNKIDDKANAKNPNYIISTLEQPNYEELP